MSSRHLVLTSQDGSPGDVDNVCCQTGDNFLYYFKGAQNAPGISPPRLRTAGRSLQVVDPSVGVGQGGPSAQRHARSGLRAGRLLPLFGPPGHGGVGAFGRPSVSTSSRHRIVPVERACLASGLVLPSSWRSSIEPGKITRKGALRASLVMPCGHPCP